jgi:hypothetical protein
MQHEQITQKEDHEFQLQCKDKDQNHEKELFDKNLGTIGRFFGSSEHASKNITATICLTLIIGVSVISSWVYYTKEDITFIKNMWTNISPIITLSLGYLFGKK